MHQSTPATPITGNPSAGDHRFPFALPAPVVGAVVTGAAVFTERADKTTRQGKPFAEVTLRNNTGGTTLKVWSEKLPLIASVSVGTPVHLTCARVISRDGTEEWTFQAIEALDPQHPVRREAMPMCPVPRATLIARTRNILDAMATETREVFERILQSDVRWPDGTLAPLKAAYADAPAAIGHHHAYLGGLWHHSLQVTEGAVALATAYAAHDAPDIDLDAVRLGGLLHDLGKVDEYAWDSVIAMAPLAASMSHMGHGIRRVTEALLRAELCDGWVPTMRQRELVEHTLHVIASHHLQKEWGAIIEPASREAYCIHSGDMTSSRVQPISDAVAVITDLGTGWIAIKDGWKKKTVFVSPTARQARDTGSQIDAAGAGAPLCQCFLPVDTPDTEA